MFLPLVNRIDKKMLMKWKWSFTTIKMNSEFFLLYYLHALNEFNSVSDSSEKTLIWFLHSHADKSSGGSEVQQMHTNAQVAVVQWKSRKQWLEGCRFDSLLSPLAKILLDEPKTGSSSLQRSRQASWSSGCGVSEPVRPPPVRIFSDKRLFRFLNVRLSTCPV